MPNGRNIRAMARSRSDGIGSRFMLYLIRKMDIGNISEHSVHISKNSEHGRSGVLLVGNGWEFVKKARKAFIHAGYSRVFISMISEHH